MWYLSVTIQVLIGRPQQLENYLVILYRPSLLVTAYSLNTIFSVISSHSARIRTYAASDTYMYLPLAIGLPWTNWYGNVAIQCDVLLQDCPMLPMLKKKSESWWWRGDNRDSERTKKEMVNLWGSRSFQWIMYAIDIPNQLYWLYRNVHTYCMPKPVLENLSEILIQMFMWSYGFPWGPCLASVWWILIVF